MENLRHLFVHLHAPSDNGSTLYELNVMRRDPRESLPWPSADLTLDWLTMRMVRANKRGADPALTNPVGGEDHFAMSRHCPVMKRRLTKDTHP